MSNLLITGVDVAGHYSGLCDGFKKISFKSDFLLIPNKFSYEQTQPPNTILSLTYSALVAKVEAYRCVSTLKFVFFYFCFRLFSCFMPFWAICRYDKIYFIGGDCFSRSKLEFYLYKLVGVKIFISFHGSDLRPLYLNGMEINSLNTKDLTELAKRTKRQKKLSQFKEKIADVVLASPSDHQFLSRHDVVNITRMGNMLNETRLRKFSSLCSKKEKLFGSIKILHCPSDFEGKGSAIISNIILKIKKRYSDVELVLAQGKSNEEILKLITECDFVVDSVWNSSPAGAFPAEAGFLGKPVIIGSYFADLKSKIFKGKNEIPPYIFVHPDDISDAIENLIKNREYRMRAGQELKDYFHNISTPKIIAERYASIFKSGPKTVDCFDPMSFVYIHGYGISETNLRRNLSKYVESNSSSALYLEHNPNLQKEIENFINESPKL